MVRSPLKSSSNAINVDKLVQDNLRLSKIVEDQNNMINQNK